jgi:hypothetical protein
MVPPGAACGKDGAASACAIGDVGVDDNGAIVPASATVSIGDAAKAVGDGAAGEGN